jgi:hypothetical protein
MDYPPKGKIDYPPISLPFSPKTENQKAEKKEKIEKKGTKKRKNFLQIFQLLPYFFSRIRN